LLKPLHHVTQIFFILSQLAAGMLAAGTASAIYLPWSSLLFRSLLVVLAPVVFHFYTLFPTPLPASSQRRALKLVYGGVGVVALVSVVLILLLKDPGGQQASAIVQRSFVAVVLVAALVLLFSRRYKTSLQARRRKRLLIASMVVSLSPLLALSFIPELISGAPLVDYAWTFPFLILLPLGYAYAVRKGELGRLDLALNRSLVYVLLATILLGIYAALFLALDWISPEADWARPVFGTVLAAITAVLYNPTRVRLQRWIDHLFYGGWYDYRTVVRAASAELSRLSVLTQLIDQLMGIIRIMRFESAVLLWPDTKAETEGEMLIPRYNSGVRAVDLEQLHMPMRGAVARHLAKSAQPSRLEQIQLAMKESGEHLSESEFSALSVVQLPLWLPLVSRGALRGVLMLGERQTEPILGDEDMDILATLAAQAAVAAENVALLEVLRARLADMERMRNELADAHRRVVKSQEVEQLHLAQELHDGAVQQLLGISYQLANHPRYPDHPWYTDGTAGAASTNGADGTDGTADTTDAAQAGETIAGTLTDTSRKSATEVPLLTQEALTPEIVRQEMLGVVRQLRELIGELRPAGLEEFGLITALEGYAARLERESGSESSVEVPAIHLDLPKGEVDLPHEIALCLFRVAQEALRNALKHSQAKNITLRLWLSADEVFLSVEDDGEGFQVPDRLYELTHTNHFGVVGIAERVKWVNGQLDVSSQPNAGTKIKVEIPLARTEIKEMEEMEVIAEKADGR
jgi:signal transduction histidine kinase